MKTQRSASALGHPREVERIERGVAVYCERWIFCARILPVGIKMVESDDLGRDCERDRLMRVWRNALGGSRVKSGTCEDAVSVWQLRLRFDPLFTWIFRREIIDRANKGFLVAGFPHDPRLREVDSVRFETCGNRIPGGNALRQSSDRADNF